MAKRASHIRMAIGQQETRRAVIEIGIRPGIERVASGAIRSGKRSSGRRMHRIVCLLPITQVTGRACGREPDVISDRGVFVAILTFHDCVRAE